MVAAKVAAGCVALFAVLTPQPGTACEGDLPQPVSVVVLPRDRDHGVLPSAPRNAELRVQSDHPVEYARLVDEHGNEVAATLTRVPEAPEDQNALVLRPVELLTPGGTYSALVGSDYAAATFQVTDVIDTEAPEAPQLVAGPLVFKKLEPSCPSVPYGWYGTARLEGAKAWRDDVFYMVHSEGALVGTHAVSFSQRGLTAIIACEDTFTPWFGDLALTAGRHVLEVRAVDLAGNVSAPSTVTVEMSCDIPVTQYLSCSTAGSPLGWSPVASVLIAALLRRSRARV